MKKKEASPPFELIYEKGRRDTPCNFPNRKGWRSRFPQDVKETAAHPSLEEGREKSAECPQPEQERVRFVTRKKGDGLSSRGTVKGKESGDSDKKQRVGGKEEEYHKKYGRVSSMSQTSGKKRKRSFT